MVDMEYAVVRWETGLVCRTPGRTARGLILLAGLGKTRRAPVIGTKLLLGASTSNRLRTRDRVANVGVPLTVIGSFFRAFINLVSGAAAAKAKVELATALSFLLVEHGGVDRSTGYANAKVFLFLLMVVLKLHENVSAFYRQLQASNACQIESRKSSPRFHMITEYSIFRAIIK